MKRFAVSGALCAKFTTALAHTLAYHLFWRPRYLHLLGVLTLLIH